MITNASFSVRELLFEGFLGTRCVSGNYQISTTLYIS